MAFVKTPRRYFATKTKWTGRRKKTMSSSTYAIDFFHKATIIWLWKGCKPTSFSFDQKPSRKTSCGVKHFGGRAGRVSLWSGKGASARVESGTRLWCGSLEPLPIGIPRLQAGEDVKFLWKVSKKYVPQWDALLMKY